MRWAVTQKLAQADVDAKLAAAGLDTAQRMLVKTELGRIKQLAPGRTLR